VVPSHAIFNEPLKVNLTIEERPTPQNYFQLPGDKKIEKTIKVWPVQTKKFPEIDPGLVSNPHGFADSPDAEVISSGLNSKGPESVALARHANFFLWGFSASPQEMTPEGRQVFINAVCYIKKFDRQKPVVRKLGAGFTRDGALFGAYYLRNVLDEAAFKRGCRKPCATIRSSTRGTARPSCATSSGRIRRRSAADSATTPRSTSAG
jgi:hypothetical protein